MIYKEVMLILVLFMAGCKSDLGKQQRFLLPTENKLKLIYSDDGIMSTIDIFSVSGLLDQKKIAKYPLQKLNGKAIKKWHKVSKQEFKDLEDFFQSEPIEDTIGEKIIKSIREGNSYVAYIYNCNKKGYAYKNHDPIPGEKGYNTMNWVDMYYLDTSPNQKKLICISYGKF